MENNVNSEIFENNGNVNISDEVIGTLATLAAKEVKGVFGMAGGGIGFAELLGKKNLSKGVKNTREENSVNLDVSVIVEYGAKIPEVAEEVQDKVKGEVELMTGLTVSAVNVLVDGVNVPLTEEKEAAEEAIEVAEEATEE